MSQPSIQQSTTQPVTTINTDPTDNDAPQSINELYPNLDQLKQKKRYRNSISTESPIVMLTPPNPDEMVREERRLSTGSIHSNTSNTSHGDNSDSNNPKNSDSIHLLPPAEPEPEEIVAKLISQRRPSTITTLSDLVKQIFTAKKIKEDGIPALIIKGIYLGSIGAAKNLEWLKTNGITHVLCVAGGIGACYPKQFVYRIIEINDDAHADITAYFKASYDFIEGCINNGGKILIHCFAGMSRSVTVTSAYLMQKRRMYAVPALKFVKAKRTVANPNAGFIVQLIKYQSTLGMKRKKSLDLPASESDNDESDCEEKMDKPKPKRKSFKAIANGLNLNSISKTYKIKKKVTNDSSNSDQKDAETEKDKDSKPATVKLSKKVSPMVKEWESGRRPSLFTALAKLRGGMLKNRARAGSTDSTHSNVSSMSDKEEKEQNELGIPPPGPNGLTPVGQCDLQLLREVSDEIDSPIQKDKQEKEINFAGLRVRSVNKSGDESEGPITPLETFNDGIFPDTNHLKTEDGDGNNQSKSADV